MGERGRPPRRSRGAHNGQHFLPAHLARAIVRNACVTSADTVVDLGAGAGALTTELASRAARVVAVEMDPALAARLRVRFDGNPSVTVVCADATSMPLPRTPYRVVANLPFARASSILDRLLSNPAVPLQRADVVVQWEAALDAAAQRPGSLRSLSWAPWWEVSITRRVPGTDFHPPASVAAGVLSITRRPDPLLHPRDAQPYARFLRVAFAGGDVRALRGLVARRALASLEAPRGPSGRIAPRDLDAAEWARLFESARTR